MDTTTVALVFFLGGSAVLCLTLKLFRVDFKVWQAVLASLAAALCVFIPNSPGGPISLVVLLATLKFTRGDTWQNLLLPGFTMGARSTRLHRVEAERIDDGERRTVRCLMQGDTVVRSGPITADELDSIVQDKWL